MGCRTVGAVIDAGRRNAGRWRPRCSMLCCASHWVLVDVARRRSSGLSPSHVSPRRDLGTARRHDHTTGKRDRRSRRSTGRRSAMRSTEPEARTRTGRRFWRHSLATSRTSPRYGSSCCGQAPSLRQGRVAPSHSASRVRSSPDTDLRFLDPAPTSRQPARSRTGPRATTSPLERYELLAGVAGGSDARVVAREPEARIGARDEHRGRHLGQGATHARRVLAEDPACLQGRAEVA
jgi:hypothetical protein